MWKPILLGAAIALLASAAGGADSPIDKGSFFLNGSVYYMGQSGDLWESNDGDGSSAFGIGNGRIGLDGAGVEISPVFGYFISPGVLVGGQFAVTGVSIGGRSLTLFAVGPSIGYYFNTDPSRSNVKGTFYPYARGFFNWGSLSMSDRSISVLQYGARSGLLYMLTRAVGADAGIQFRGDRWDFDDDDDAETGTTISLGVGITAFIY